MDFRILRYFLNVAKEQSFTKAAKQLHITQPTLSRQLAALEEELGVTLFARSGRNITLTEEGILFKRRALEILDLEERTLDELKGSEGSVEGTVTIGCGEFAVVETLAEICRNYQQKYPRVQIALHTATADTISEMMNKGLVDIIARFQFALHHAWNIRRDMTVMAFSSHAGGVLEMHRLFIFFIHRLHTVATDTKFGCAGDFDPNVWQYNQRNANHNPNCDQRQYRPTSTGSA